MCLTIPFLFKLRTPPMFWVFYIDNFTQLDYNKIKGYRILKIRDLNYSLASYKEGDRQMNNTNTIGAEGTNEALQSAFNQFAQQVGHQTQVQEQVTQTHTADENHNQDQQVQVTETPQPQVQQPQSDPTNKAFAQMRISNNEMSQRLAAIEKALQAQGHASIDAYLQAQQQAEVQNKAQQQGISPELEKRLRALEAENQRYRENERMSSLNQQVGNLVQKYGITQDQWQNFAQQVANKGINVLDSNVSLETLYVQFNMDYIINQRIEAEKQKWIAEAGRANTAPINTPVGVPQTTNTEPRKVDLKQLAVNFANSKK